MAVFTATTSDGKPLFGVTDSETYKRFRDKKRFPWLLEILIHFENSEDNGLPSSTELYAINAVEDELLAALAGVTQIHNVGHITGGGMRVFFCYLSEPATANSLLTTLTNKPSKRHFDYRVTKDPKWDAAKRLGI